MLKKKTIPIGDLVDKLYRQDMEVKDIEATLREAKALRDTIQRKVLKKLSTDNLDGVKGKIATATIRSTPHPSIKNRPKFLKYVIANKAWDLFQNRIMAKAYKDRTEDGEYIPGVKVFTSIRVSVTRRK